MKLNRITQWAKEVRNRYKLKQIWETLCAKLRGHIQYYGVSFNLESVRKFIYGATRILFKWLNCRSQRKSFNWESFNRFIQANSPPPNEDLSFAFLSHPYSTPVKIALFYAVVPWHALSSHLAKSAVSGHAQYTKRNVAS